MIEELIDAVDKVATLKQLVLAAAAVLDSEDDTGCSGDCTVVSKEAIELLWKALHG